VLVPPDARTFLFPILTFKVGAPTSVTITANVLGQAATAMVQLLPPSFPPSPPVPAPAGAPELVLFPNPVPGGLLALGQVTLAQPAGPGGLLVTLASTRPDIAVVPAAVTVLPGAAAATFPIITLPVTGLTAVPITAGSAFGPATATLQVLPLSPSPLVFTIHGATYATSDRQETLTATFTRPDGGVTANGYQGYVLLHVTGVGQSYGPVYNDAFYLFTGPFDPPKNGHDGGYYQLTFGTSPLPAFCLGCNAMESV
jgi:hypothetical protein